MNVYDKISNGLPLTSDDIRELLKDPNSWVSQLYAECQRVAALSEIIIIEMIVRIAEELRLEKEAQARDSIERSGIVTSDHRADNKVFNDVREQGKFKDKLDALLELPINFMSTIQLTLHAQNIMQNVNNQVVSQLAMNNNPLLNGIRIPITVPTPVSVAEVLSQNPALAVQVNNEPATRSAFVNMFYGPLNSYKIFAELLQSKGLTPESLTQTERFAGIRAIDKCLKQVFNEVGGAMNKLSTITETIINQLANNQQAALSAYGKSDLGTTPRFTCKQPLRSKKDDEEENINYKNPKRK